MKIIKTKPYSIEDIHDFLSNNHIDIEKSVVHIDIIEQLNYDITKLMKENYSIILFLPNPNSNEELPEDHEDMIGHFVLLSEFPSYIEWFCSFASPVPESILELGRRCGKEVIYSKIKLQHDKNYICGKYCLARMQSLPADMEIFIDILRSNKKYSPDEIIDNMYRLKIFNLKQQ